MPLLLLVIHNGQSDFFEVLGVLAASRACCTAGRSSAMRIAMIVTTTNSSTKVKPSQWDVRFMVTALSSRLQCPAHTIRRSNLTVADARTGKALRSWSCAAVSFALPSTTRRSRATETLYATWSSRGSMRLSVFSLEIACHVGNSESLSLWYNSLGVLSRASISPRRRECHE
jgi:hypothetical protein